MTRFPLIIKLYYSLLLTLESLNCLPCNFLRYFEPAELIQRDLSLMSVGLVYLIKKVNTWKKVGLAELQN